MKRFKLIYKVLFILALIIIPFSVVYAQGANPPIQLAAITPFTLGSIIATVLSLVLDYAPVIAAKYDALTVAQKRGLAAVFAVVIVAGVFALTCYGIVSSNLQCTYVGAWDAISNVIWVFVIGQGVHAGTMPTQKFKTEVLDIDPKSRGK